MPNTNPLPELIPFNPTTYPPHQLLERSSSFYRWLNERRTCRDFSDAPIDPAVMEQIVLAAGTAPSGAHKQPWHFCLVSNPQLKREIRLAAEAEEYESYTHRMSAEWLEDLAPIGTNWEKPFLEIAPYLVVVFRQPYVVQANGSKRQNYYVQESCGIACGLLLAAIHHAGLIALTHTPSPMNFLTALLKRPENEKPFLLIPVGYPAQDSQVPNLTRKPLDAIATWYR
jgi:nitroreductase